MLSPKAPRWCIWHLTGRLILTLLPVSSSVMKLISILLSGTISALIRAEWYGTQALLGKYHPLPDAQHHQRISLRN